MLTKITIRNFKKFEESEIPLGNGFVFVGPNNSRKTTALQALTLWRAGLDEWTIKKASSARKYGVTINRKDLVFLPTSHANDLWRNRKTGGNERIRIDLIMEGNDNGENWKCGLEFEYATAETIYCRPLREDEGGKNKMPIPPPANDVRIVLLPPMSGLVSVEPLIQSGRINVLLGQGRTAEVLRNICYGVFEKKDDGKSWEKLKKNIKELFHVELQDPVSNPGTGDITCRYKENKTTLDLQSAGRGMQQVMLLLSFLYYHEKNTVFLLDEPDAHLETLRQQQIYRRLREIAHEQNSQIIVASHSEKLLEEAGGKNSAVAFLGNSPQILGSGKMGEVKKSLSEIESIDYYHAELKKLILYLEGETDLDILIKFAKRLGHPSYNILNGDIFSHFIRTDKGKSKYGHFFALKLAVPDLVGIMLTDHEPTGEGPSKKLKHLAWKKREIENYLCTRNTLINYAGGKPDLFEKKRRATMEEEIKKIEESLKNLNKESIFSPTSKASDYMETLFRNYAAAMQIPPLTKKDFHLLVDYIPDEDISPEITEKLDMIHKISSSVENEKQ